MSSNPTAPTNRFNELDETKTGLVPVFCFCDTFCDTFVCATSLLPDSLFNAYAKSLSRTAKSRPEFPVKGFSHLGNACVWAVSFVRWYNVGHRHSGVCYVSSAQRPAAEDHAIPVARHALFAMARELNPATWSGKTLTMFDRRRSDTQS